MLLKGSILYVRKMMVLEMWLRTYLGQFGHAKHLGSFCNEKMWLGKINESHLTW